MSPVKQFSIGGAVGIAIGLIGAGVQSRWPEKNVGTWLIGVGVALLFAVFIAWVVRRSTIREYERTHSHKLPEPQPPAQQLNQTANPQNEFSPRLDYSPQNVFSPKIDVHVPVSQPQNVKTAPEPTRNPVFECRGTRFRRYGFNLQTGELIREQYEGDPSEVYDHIKFVNAGLARFLYRADPGVDARLRVNAHVFMYEINVARMGELRPERLAEWSKDKQGCDLYKPIWDDDEPHVSVEFSAGYTHELIMMLIPAEEMPTGVIGYEHGTKIVGSYTGSDRVFAPEIHNLLGKRFVIKVELIPKLWNDVRCKLPVFWFELSLFPPTPALTFLGAVDD